jgi:pimeloyl-ACP methyl ester carboxylesterase
VIYRGASMATRETAALPSGVKVRTLDEGSGPVVLLLHGHPDNADEYRGLIDLLKKDFRCIAPDLPGYGRRNQTAKLPATFDYSRESQVAFVDEVLEALKVDGPVSPSRNSPGSAWPTCSVPEASSAVRWLRST